MRRLLLIANPSSSGFTGALHREVVSVLGRDFDVTVIWPVSPADAKQRAADAEAEGYAVVAAMGGDGVVHHVANGLAHTATSLAIIPAGTTNVAARVHGLPNDAVKAARIVVGATPQPSPLALITSDDGPRALSEHAIFALGVGFDADVVDTAEQFPHSKSWFGSLHFARAAMTRVTGSYWGLEPNMTISIGGDEERIVTVFVQIHDLYTYFGRLPIRFARGGGEPPTALAIEQIDPLLATRIVTRLSFGRDPARLPGVHRWGGFRNLDIYGDVRVPLQADGEHLGNAKRITVTWVPEGLLVLRP